MKYFFSGIGGIGMSGLALYANKDNIVYGSNNLENERINHLRKKGIKINIGHDSKLPDIDVLIKSTAIRDDNPEIIQAKKNGIKIMYRMQYLNEILLNNYSIGITGTDGKTSTTAMLSQIYKFTDYNPTVFLGGIHDSLTEGNFRLGKDIIISEVDESDGHIINTKCDIALINNLRPDHLEHYDENFDNLEKALKNFANSAREKVIINKDDEYLSKWDLSNFITFGTKDADYIMKNRKTKGIYQEFEIYKKEEKLGVIELKIPGEHYALDAFAACVIALENNIEFNIMKMALKEFKTVDRRFNILYDNQTYIIDDYAHIPQEIFMTINAAKEYFKNKEIVTILQPHRYTRLHRSFDGFVNCVKNSDEVIIFRMYSAFEDPIEGVDEKKLVSEIQNLNIKTSYYDDMNELSKLLKEKYKNKVLLFVGAGDITKLAHMTKDEFQK